MDLAESETSKLLAHLDGIDLQVIERIDTLCTEVTGELGSAVDKVEALRGHFQRLNAACEEFRTSVDAALEETSESCSDVAEALTGKIDELEQEGESELREFVDELTTSCIDAATAATRETSDTVCEAVGSELIEELRGAVEGLTEQAFSAGEAAVQEVLDAMSEGVAQCKSEIVEAMVGASGGRHEGESLTSYLDGLMQPLQDAVIRVRALASMVGMDF